MSSFLPASSEMSSGVSSSYSLGGSSPDPLARAMEAALVTPTLATTPSLRERVRQSNQITRDFIQYRATFQISSYEPFVKLDEQQFLSLYTQLNTLANRSLPLARANYNTRRYTQKIMKTCKFYFAKTSIAELYSALTEIDPQLAEMSFSMAEASLIGRISELCRAASRERVLFIKLCEKYCQ